ncbi:TRAP transporter large permease [Phaeovulum sp. NW3]|uniref:TRAP transporter large permease n=1 Tax=Phaeovulum sp. NW3 TaxID=2934933 RepID=UPI0020207909|nr:TRAP transporter large permease [Phaeovulum sp. NW3]MCL7465320.1 TRAP transporter large permease [Phaeovulum sp. NW3]
MIWAVMGGTLLGTVLTGAVLGAALGLTGFAILHFWSGGATSLGVQAVWNTFNSFTLTAIPLFILLGEILVASGLARNIYRALSPLFSRLPGGLLHTNIAVCGLFGAVSGSSMAVAAAVGSVAYPELTRRGYDRRAVVGTLAGGGTLGLLIPPSLSLLIYGAFTETSIGKLFLAGVLPGIVAALAFMAWIVIQARRNRTIAPDEPRVPIGPALRALAETWPLLTLILAVLGSLFAGLATPTESAGVGVLAAIVIGFTKGDLTLAGIGQALMTTVTTFSVIGMVFMGAVILAQSISVLGLPQQLLRMLTELQIGPLELLAVVVLIYVLLGMVFDGLSMMIMTLPIVFPLLVGVGYDPVWLGVVITLLIEIGMLTPPVGMNIFVVIGMTNGEVRLGEGALAVLPYWLVLLGLIALITAFPGLVLWLPGLVAL